MSSTRRHCTAGEVALALTLPDGSDVEVFCGGGMDNPVEVDFTPEGEMFGTVNILIGRPRVDCLMHWVQGGVYPRDDHPELQLETINARWVWQLTELEVR